MLLQFIINGLITGLIYALIALAFSLTYNTTKIFHIAYASVIVSAGYFALWFIQIGIPTVIAICLTLIFCGGLNLLVEKSIYQTMERRKNLPNTIMVASIGAFIVLTNLIALLFGNENQVLDQSISKGIEIGDIIVTKMQLWQFVISLPVIGAILVTVNKTELGLKIKALSNDSELFAVFGNDSYRLRSRLFIISGIIGGIASLLLAYDVGFDPYFGMGILLNAMVAMIIGGIGSYKGSLVGGIFLGITQSLSVYLFEARWETAITFAIFWLVLVIRPQGLFGKKLRWI